MVIEVCECAVNLIYSSHTGFDVTQYMSKAFRARRICCLCAPSATHTYVQHNRKMFDFLCMLCKPKVITKLQHYEATVAFVISGLVISGINELRHLDYSICYKPILIMGPSTPANCLDEWKTFKKGEWNMYFVMPSLQNWGDSQS